MLLILLNFLEMDNLVEELKKNLDAMSDEELDALVESLKPYSKIGPTVEEYIEYVENLNNSIYSEEI